MVVRISGDGSISGLTDWEATSVTHPDSADTNITLADDGSVVFDSIPADIQTAIDNIPQIAGIGLNVVSAVKVDAFTTTSSSYTDVTGLSVSITPEKNTSKILIIASIGLSTNAVGGQIVHARLLRDSTEIGGNTSGSAGRTGFGFVNGWNPFTHQVIQTNLTIVDSPASASSVVYKIQVRRTSDTAYVNRAGNDTSNGATSSITAIEVAA